MNASIGARIKELRKELKMTQEELAGSEMTKSMLSHIENGQANPSMKNLQHIAKRLNRPVSFFLDEEGEHKIHIDDNQGNFDEGIFQKIKLIDEMCRKGKYSEALVEARGVFNLHQSDKKSRMYADIMHRYGWCLILTGSTGEGLEYLNQALKIFVDNNFYNDVIKVYTKIIYGMLVRYKYNEAFETIGKAEELYAKTCESDPLLEIELMFRKCTVYFAWGQYDNVIALCEKIVAICSETKVYYRSAAAYRLMARCYYMSGNIEKFLESNEKSRQFALVTEDNYTLSMVYQNYAIYENDLNSPGKALEYLKLYEKHTVQREGVYYVELGKAKYLMGDFEGAVDELLKINYNEKLNFMWDMIYVLTGKIYMGLSYMKLKKYDNACEKINDAINQIDKYTRVEFRCFAEYAWEQLSFAYESLGKVYASMGDFEKGFEAMSKSVEAKKMRG